MHTYVAMHCRNIIPPSPASCFVSLFGLTLLSIDPYELLIHYPITATNSS